MLGGEDMVEGLLFSVDVLNIFVRLYLVEMKKEYGVFGGGGVILEKLKLDLL